MYGRSGSVLGVTSIIGGVAVLPNTGGNSLLTILDIVTMTAGAIIIGSFVITRIATKFNR